MRVHSETGFMRGVLIVALGSFGVAATAQEGQSTSGGTVAAASGGEGAQQDPFAPLLGSSTTDQVYTPVTPCRFVDGINADDRVPAPANGTTARYYRVRGSTASDFVSQGAAATAPTGCGIPASATAVMVNFTVADPDADGDLRVDPSDASTPSTTSVLNYTFGGARGKNLANGIVVKLCSPSLPCASGATPTSPTRDILVTFHAGASAVSTYFIADVLGYFAPAAGGLLSNGTTAGNTPFWNGTTWVANSSNLFNDGGNIGIGTVSPTSRLEVALSSGTGIRSSATAGFSTIDINASNGDAALRFFDNGSSRWNMRNDPANDNLQIFELGASERLRIENSTGRVVLSGSGTTEQLQVVGNVKVGTGTTGCVMDADGTVLTGTCSSDLRFKKDITPFVRTLERLTSLSPVNYFWRAVEFAEMRFGTRQSFGLIAQEVQKLFPELVVVDDKGYLAVNYSKLPLLTIQAVKELKAENDELKARNAAIEARLAALESALSAKTGK